MTIKKKITSLVIKSKKLRYTNTTKEKNMKKQEFINRIRFAAVSLGVITPIDALTKNQLLNTKSK